MRSLGRNLVFLVALCLVLGVAVATLAAGPAEKCSNGKDDDRDGAIDCDDDDCFSDPVCLGGPPPPDNCQILFNGDFTEGGGECVQSDELQCLADPSYQYCDADQKVLMDFLIAGGDGDPRAVFRFNSNVGPVRTRKGETVRTAWINLSDFADGGGGCWLDGNGAFLDPFGGCATDGQLPITLGFYSGRGGLNICDLCVKGAPQCLATDDTCYKGHAVDVGYIPDATVCAEGELSWRGAVGLFLNFPVEGAIWGKMALIYNPKWSGGEHCPAARPGIVERTGLDTWKITGTTACLINGGASGWEVLADGGDANFELTITTQP